MSEIVVLNDVDVFESKKRLNFEIGAIDKCIAGMNDELYNHELTIEDYELELKDLKRTRAMMVALLAVCDEIEEIFSGS